MGEAGGYHSGIEEGDKIRARMPVALNAHPPPLVVGYSYRYCRYCGLICCDSCCPCCNVTVYQFALPGCRFPSMLLSGLRLAHLSPCTGCTTTGNCFYIVYLQYNCPAQSTTHSGCWRTILAVVVAMVAVVVLLK